MSTSYDASSPREVRSPAQGGGSRAQLEPRVQSALGRELRAIYDDVVSQPVPDRFVELLNQLDERESSDKGDKR